MKLLAPNPTDPGGLVATMHEQGYAVLSAQGVSDLTGCSLDELMALRLTWDDLPPDNYLKDGGRYRRRRHLSLVVRDDAVELAPHRAHWQPLEYNALHGGMKRWFVPVTDAVARSSAWSKLVQTLAHVCSQLKGVQPWYVEAHQFRIDTEGGIGRPTPEGAHRDGVDFVAVFLVARDAIKGGETRVFDADGPRGERFTLSDPWSLLLLDDERVIHESTPIQPAGERGGHRDTLVLTYRRRGFLDG